MEFLDKFYKGSRSSSECLHASFTALQFAPSGVGCRLKVLKVAASEASASMFHAPRFRQGMLCSVASWNSLAARMMFFFDL